MILILWTILIITSFAIIFLGNKFDTTISEVLILAGWIFIFTLGLLMTLNQVQYENGTQTTITNTYEIDTYNVSILTASQINETKQYDTFSNKSNTLIGKLDGSHIFGLLLAVLGGFGFATFWYDKKQRNKENY